MSGVKVQKRPVTLMEVLIAMGLLAVLMSSLFGYYRQLEVIGTRIKELRSDSFQYRYSQYRLAQLLPKVVNENNKDHVFFTSDQVAETIRGSSLVFTFDRGVDIDPEFSNEVLARLFLDDGGRLCLATWPAPSRTGESIPPMHREVLLNKVTALAFQFFVPPPTSDQPIDTSDKVTTGKEQVIPPQGQWLDRWEANYQGLPAMVRVLVTRRDKGETKTLTFAFPLLESLQHVVYQR